MSKPKQRKEPTECPKCHASWIGPDIYEKLKETYPDKTDETLMNWARDYGWTPENGLTFMMQKAIYDMEEDRTVAWECPNCNERIPR